MDKKRTIIIQHGNDVLVTGGHGQVDRGAPISVHQLRIRPCRTEIESQRIGFGGRKTNHYLITSRT